MANLVRYSDTDLNEFKSLIEHKLQKARAELKYLYDQITGTEDNGDSHHSGDYFDYSSRHIEMEMLNKMASRQRLFIRNLENALLRIKNKTYGICSITGQLIRKERLMLVPHATKSVAGKHSTPQAQRQSVRPSSGPASKLRDRIISKKPNHNSDSITSSQEEEDSDIEFLEMPRDLVDLKPEDFIDFD